MKVKMTQKDILCNQDRERYKKSWDYYCVAGDMWSAGYKAAIETVTNHLAINHVGGEMFQISLTNIALLLSEKLEVELKDGEHQIGAKLTDK